MANSMSSFLFNQSELITLKEKAMNNLETMQSNYKLYCELYKLYAATEDLNTELPATKRFLVS